MRAWTLVWLLVLAACDRRGATTSTTPAAPAPQPVASATQPVPPRTDEEQVLELALRAFAYSGDEVWLRPTPQKPRLVIHHQTEAKSGMLTDSQLGSDLRGTGRAIPLDVRRDLQGRNTGSAPLAGHRFIDGRLHVADVDGAMGNDFLTRDEKFEAAFPNAFAYAHVWLPGFSADGKEAVVRFWFGPTLHGATATYYMARGRQGWRIKWRKIAHYL